MSQFDPQRHFVAKGLFQRGFRNRSSGSGDGVQRGSVGSETAPRGSISAEAVFKAEISRAL
jgi:hypothetical protein